MTETNEDHTPEKKIFGFHQNIFFMGVVSLLNDIASEMIYPLLPIFMTSVLGDGRLSVSRWHLQQGQLWH